MGRPLGEHRSYRITQSPNLNIGRDQVISREQEVGTIGVILQQKQSGWDGSGSNG